MAGDNNNGSESIRNAVPSLYGVDNYQDSIFYLEHAICHENPKLWKIIMGEYALESYDPIELSVAQIRAQAVAHLNVSGSS